MWDIPFHSRAIPCDDPGFVYHESDDIDVQRTWRKFGWTPIVRDEVPPVNSLKEEKRWAKSPSSPSSSSKE